MAIGMASIMAVAFDGRGRLQPVHGLPRERSHRHQQQQRIDEGGQARALPAIRVAHVRAQAPGECATPGEHQAGHVTEVVAGIGQQGQRVDFPAVVGLDRDEGVFSPMPMPEAALKLAGAWLWSSPALMRNQFFGASRR